MQDILDNLLKEERKSKFKDKENFKVATNSFALAEPEEFPPVASIPSPIKIDTKKVQEEKELLEVSLMDDDDDFPLQQLEKAEEKSKPKPAPVVTDKPLVAPKNITAKPINIESTIFNELQGIDFETEIRAEDEGKIDWNTVRNYCAIPTFSHSRKI